MKQLQLKVGKSYVTNSGITIIKIIEKLSSGKFPFKDSNGFTYTEKGLWNTNYPEHKDNLKAEFSEKEK